MMKMILNGDFCEDEKIIVDNGYFFGLGLFETILIKGGPVFLKEHLDRLNSGLKILGIDRFIEEEYAISNIEKLRCRNCAVKIAVSEKNIIFSTREIHYEEEQYDAGFKLKVSRIRRNKYSHTVYLKSLNYGDNMLERNAALSQGFDEVLFLNNEGYAAEGSVSNLFFIKDGKICTPSVDCGLLDGIIRSWVINEYSVEEGEYTLEDILNSEGAFITNSLLGIMKVSGIDGKVLKQNTVTENIRNNYLRTTALL